MKCKTVKQPAREIPVIGEYDVVVCGGGAAGCAAAIAAARHGARTLVIEKDGYLGGATVSQQVSHILSTNGVDFQGIWHDWIRALRRRNGVTALLGGPPQFRGGVDAEVVKYAWDDLLTEAGVEQLLHAWCSDAITEDDVCRGVLLETRCGRCAIHAKRVIDCTADAVICAAAGVEWEQGNGEEPWNQAMTKVFRMGNVRWPESGYEKADIERFQQQLETAIKNKEYDSPVVINGRVINYGTGNWVHQSVLPYRSEHNEFPSRVLRVNPLDPWDVTRAEREGRDQAWQCADFLKRYVAGYEKAYLLDTNAHIGMRDSRRVCGQVRTTEEDVWQLRKYPDEVARSSWNIDIWPGDSYDAAAVPHGDQQYEQWKQHIVKGDYFSVRYGCLVAGCIDNLLVAGRCLSAERQAQASLRIQQTCQATGEAAGTIAALSLDAGETPRQLEPGIVVKALAKARDVEPAFPELSDIGVVRNERIQKDD